MLSDRLKPGMDVWHADPPERLPMRVKVLSEFGDGWRFIFQEDGGKPFVGYASECDPTRAESVARAVGACSERADSCRRRADEYDRFAAALLAATAPDQPVTVSIAGPHAAELGDHPCVHDDPEAVDYGGAPPAAKPKAEDTVDMKPRS